MDNENNVNNENEELDNNIVTLKDEDGNDINFEFLDMIEFEGENYVILLPAEETDDEESDEVVILKEEKDAIKMYSECQPDIIFMDIEIKENEADENASDRVNGVECARILSNINPDLKIIFVTAHSEYMSNAFDIYAYDYIVKPFDIQRVERTLRRIAASGENVTSSDNTGKVKSSPGRKMMIRGRESTNFIDIDEIVMVERQGKSTIIHTIRDEYNTSMGLGDIEEKLTDSKFIRSHKSFIINMDYVSRIEPYGRWTYIVKFNGKDYDALITSSKYDEIKKIYG